MCTAITYQTKNFYFGRTLDYEHSFQEEILLTPRRYPLLFRHCGLPSRRYAILGMGCVAEGYPLYFDAINEKGLAMAGLNFVGFHRHQTPRADRDNIAQFELIPWILCQCKDLQDARQLLARLNITGDNFREDMPATQLHWLIADKTGALAVESLQEGLRIYENPVGVLTNAPPFDQQMLRLADHMQISSRPPENRFSDRLPLEPYSRGMGAFGLPGDLSSPSRFIRAAFTKLNSVCDGSEEDSVSQVFHILETVSQTRGCCRLDDGSCEKTIYTACCNADKGIYYYKTYENHRIHAVSMRAEDPEGTEVLRWPLQRVPEIGLQNGSL